MSYEKALSLITGGGSGATIYHLKDAGNNATAYKDEALTDGATSAEMAEAFGSGLIIFFSDGKPLGIAVAAYITQSQTELYYFNGESQETVNAGAY